METSTAIKFGINRVLGKFNLQLETLTSEKTERERLEKLARTEHFQKPAFPIPPSFGTSCFDQLLERLPEYLHRFVSFKDSANNVVGYSYATNYYTSPDTEILYAMLRLHKPSTVMEVGSGSSTKIMRQAIIDGGLATNLISIDPKPRIEIDQLVDICYRERVESLRMKELFQTLKAGDVLFIDSSHQVKTGSDVVYLLLEVLPKLATGVIIHLHDIFLPYDYPKRWVVEKRWAFNEQYLVQAMLMFSDAFDVIWPAHFVQRTRPDFGGLFPCWTGAEACSLWLQKVSQKSNGSA
jgi:predicted O-methyltransferase YrrM